MYRRTLLSVFLVIAAPANAVDLFSDSAMPQAQNNTCQSYALALALAVQGDPAFPIDSFDELRAVEADIRRILESIDQGTPYTHTNWPVAMERLTGGAYSFSIEYEADIVEWMSTVRDATTLGSQASILVAQLSGEPIEVVLTSVTSLDGSTYQNGHILGILGLVGTAVNSDTQLLAFNSAIKGTDGSVNRCSPGDQPGDHRYSAGVVQTGSFQLRDWGDGALIMKLVPN